MKIFFTSDPHLGDERLHLFPRHFKNAYDFALNYATNWNKLIQDEDLVYVLGDWATDEEYMHEWTPQLRGNKILIKGNYDTFPEEEYKKHFSEVTENIQIEEYDNITKETIKFNLVHYPSKSIPERFNIVGHIHGAWRVQKNMINVGCDVWNYYPVPLETILFKRNGIINFYDQDVWVHNHVANETHKERGKAGTYWERNFKGTKDAL